MKKIMRFSLINSILIALMSISTLVFAAPPDPSNYTGSNDYNTNSITVIGNQLIQIISN